MINTDYILSTNPASSEIKSRYQQILENLPVAIYTCDTNGFITEYNEAAAKLWGRHPEIGKDLWCGSWKIYQPDGSPMELESCPMAITLKEGRSVYGSEIVIERPDGSRRSVTPFPTPIFDHSGELTGAVNMLQDITERKEFEAKTARLAAIVASSDDAIVSKDLNGVVASWNDSAERIFGYTAEEMIGQPITKVIPPDRLDEEPLILSRLRQGERVDHFETKRMRKNGEIIDVSLAISPIRDSSGRVIAVSKVARDITQQKKAEEIIRENEERFRMAVAATQLGTWVYSPATGDLSWSDECRNIYQLPKEIQPDFELFTKLIHPEDSEYTLKAIAESLRPEGNGDYDIEFRILRYGDGAARWIRSQGKVYFNDAQQPEKFMGTVLDITDDKLAKVELERKVDERTRDLKEANLQLEASNSELEEFAFVASHDLQEPLRKIQAFGDMLRAKMPVDCAPDVNDLVVRMQSASLRMKTLIDSLLSFSRLSFTQEQHQLVNLSTLVDAVLADLETSIKDKNAVIRQGKLFPVKGEPMHLRQLFQNLIGNALKFAKPGLAPEVSITSKLVRGNESGLQVSAEDADKTFQLIEVKDNGIGFEPEYSAKIFQLFQRLHGKTEYPGSGVGLSIVQKVISAHNGYIRAVSEPGQGANFQFLLRFEG